MHRYSPAAGMVLGLALVLFPVGPLSGQGQDCYLARGDMDQAAQRPSPLGATTISMGDRTATVCYGRPSANGRTVMGELVPFGQAWRLGANEATAIHLPFAAEVGGIELEPGSYSLYAVPGPEEWTIFLNSSYERWGVPINDEVRATEVGSFSRPAEAMDGMVEQLTLSWDGHGPDMGHLVVEWEHTRVEIPVHMKGM